MEQAKSNPHQPELKPPLWVRAVVFGVAYLACATLGRFLSFRPEAFISFWLPSGLFVATLLIHERRHWPAFIVAGWLANTGFDLSNGQTLQITTLFSLANTLNAATGAWLVQRFITERPTLGTMREVAGLLSLTTISAALGASIGAAVVAHLLGAGSYLSTWLLWWTGDLVGIYLMAPLVISWRELFHRPWRISWSRDQTEEALYMGFIFLGSIYIFYDPWHPAIALKYLAIPALVFGAIRYGLPATTLANLVIALIEAWCTTNGLSHISVSGLPHRSQALTLQLFLATLASSGMVTASLVTERKRSGEALLRSQSMLARTEQIATIGSWNWEVATDTVTWSDQMYRILQRDPAEGALSFAEHPKLYPPEDFTRLKQAVERALTEGLPYELELRNIRRDGAVRICLVRGLAEKDASGKVTHLVGSLQDITERRLAEEESAKYQAQIQQSRKLDSLGTLAGGLAHEMNNVLGAILGYASAYLHTQPTGSPLYLALETIGRAAERGGKTVQKLLSFAHQTPAANDLIEMNTVLKEQVALLERTTLAKVRLEMDLEPNLHLILGDPSALDQVLMNVCLNAVDAMPEGGTLTFLSRNVDQHWIEVVVEDTGTGMPKEVLAKAMDPFFTTKGTGKGTGLGLSIVFRIVEAHRGQIEILSELGKGTQVRMRFPASTLGQATPEPTASEPAQRASVAVRVLLVDDDDLIQSALRIVLEDLGHTVTSARSGEEALVLLEAGDEPDLVILDMNMPGLGGVGTLPRLRSLRPKVPILLATGRIDQTALTLVAGHPGVTLLAKPFGQPALQKYIASLELG